MFIFISIERVLLIVMEIKRAKVSSRYLYNMIAAGASAAVVMAVLFGFAMFGVVPFTSAGTYNGNVAATVNVPAICSITLTPNTIDFGSIAPQGNVPTSNQITDDNTGDIIANTLIDGTAWSGAPGSFGVSNTLWDSSTQATYNGIALSNTLTLTSVDVGAYSSNSFYFGLGIPGTVLAGTYSQTITIENSC